MPEVSIIVPCFNEEATIEYLLQAISSQTYPQSDLEVIIADGNSTDATRARIADFAFRHKELSISVVDNPKRIIPAGLNQAIHHAKGKYIIRLDAHSIPSPDYVQLCVNHLKDGIADNVGGLWVIKPIDERWISRSISLAAAHPIGVGDARYRYSQVKGYVETVPFGSFSIETFKKIGNFNEELLTNEDYELNVRILKNGGKIFFDPKIKSIYFSRSNLLALSKQYWRYGYWKLQMLRKYPNTLRWRQALPPLFVLGLSGLVLFAPFVWIVRITLAMIMASYVSILLITAIPTALRNKDYLAIIGIPLAVAVMHFSWGSGFIWSMVKSLVRRKQ